LSSTDFFVMEEIIFSEADSIAITSEFDGITFYEI
jgi:hypothetical protein